MKRKVKCLCMAAAASLLFCGCGSDFPQLTDEQAEMVAEYAAINLLKYDVNNRSRLVDLEAEAAPGVTVPQPEIVKPEESPKPSMPDDTPVIEIGANMGEESLESFYDLPEGLMVVYSGSEVCQNYSADANDYFSLAATDGKSLLVLRFMLHNSTGTDQTVNFIDRDDLYRVTVNQDYKRNALTTMLANDMTTYTGTVPVGSDREVVILVEIDQEQAENLTSITLNLKNELKSYTIQLL